LRRGPKPKYTRTEMGVGGPKTSAGQERRGQKGKFKNQKGKALFSGNPAKKAWRKRKARGGRKKAKFRVKLRARLGGGEGLGEGGRSKGSKKSGPKTNKKDQGGLGQGEMHLGKGSLLGHWEQKRKRGLDKGSLKQQKT